MDTLLIFTSLLLVLAGIIGSFLPVIPGPITSWFGLFTIHYINDFSENNFLLWTTFIIAILIFIIDYFIPIIGSKFLGGTKYGIIGTSVGLVIGLISPIPFGIIIGAFLGALLGEIIGGKNIYQAAKPAITAAQLGKAREYILAGGDIKAIEAKYKLSENHRKALLVADDNK